MENQKIFLVLEYLFLVPNLARDYNIILPSQPS